MCIMTLTIFALRKGCANKTGTNQYFILIYFSDNIVCQVKFAGFTSI